MRRPSQHFLFEVGVFGFGIHDGAFGGGVEVGYRISRWLAIGAWLEGSGKREQAKVGWSPAYRLYDLGLGLTVGETVGPLLADVSVLPELTRLTVEDKYLVSGNSGTRWGAAAAARLRLGLLLGPWCPFIFVAGSYPLWAERFTVYEPHVVSGTTTLPRGNVSLGLGLAYLFGAAGSYERAPGARGLMTFGAVTTEAGIALLAVGLLLSSDETYENGRGNVTSAWGYAGKTMALTGGVSVAAGLSITILGYYRRTAPLKDGTQDAGTGNNVLSLRPPAAAQRAAASRWAVSPSLGPRQAGLVLDAAF